MLAAHGNGGIVGDGSIAKAGSPWGESRQPQRKTARRSFAPDSIAASEFSTAVEASSCPRPQHFCAPEYAMRWIGHPVRGVRLLDKVPHDMDKRIATKFPLLSRSDLRGH